MLLEVRSSSNDLHQQAVGRLPGLSFTPWLQPGVNANSETRKPFQRFGSAELLRLERKPLKRLENGVALLQYRAKAAL